jgi:PAS domain-containing protein
VANKEIEVILIRQLASYLAMPTFIVDPAGTLVFYNEPAEHLLGRRFDESGEIAAIEWTTAWAPTDEAGAPLAPEDLPLWIALEKQHPAHRRFWIVGSDKVRRHIEVIAFPLVGQASRHLGAVAISWELGETCE